MKIALSYCYKPFTTAVYLEKALSASHDVLYFGSGDVGRPGYDNSVDLFQFLSRYGMPQFFFYIEPAINHFPRGVERLPIPTACYLIDVHRALWVRERLAYFFDYIFVAQKDYISHFKSIGHKHVHWLPLGCDSDIHGDQGLERSYDVGFVGKTGRPGHERCESLRALSSEFKMNDFSRWYDKEEISRVYSASKIVVNEPVNGDVNMRVFEAMAAGALLITKRVGNGQSELFKDGVNIVEYDGREDLFGKVRYYLANEGERRKIADAGKELVLASHTYSKRSESVLNVVFSGGAPELTAMARHGTPAEVHFHYSKVFSMMRLVDPIFEEIRTSFKDNGFSLGLLRELLVAFLKSVNLTRLAKVRKAQ